MTTNGLRPVSVDAAIAALSFLSNRTPLTTDEESAGAFREICTYRDGGVFVGHWAGTSGWERHSVGDEMVMVIDGETTLFVYGDDGDQPNPLRAGVFVVPEGRGTGSKLDAGSRC